MAITSGNSEPLSHVDDDGTECPPRLPGHRASGGRTVQRLRARSRERPRRSPSRRTVSQRRPPRPQCPGEPVTFELCVRAESRGPRPEGRASSGRCTGAPRAGETPLRRPEQCPASDKPELEDRVEALTGSAPRQQFHPGLPLQFAGPQDLAYVDEGFPVVQLQGVAYVPGTYGYPGFACGAVSSTNPTA